MPADVSVTILEERTHRTIVYNILNRWGVDILGYGVMLRESKDFPEDDPIPTLLIIAHKAKKDQSWVKTSLQVREYLVDQGFGEISIEITDRKAFQPPICAPVERSHPMHDAWENICNMSTNEISLEDCRILECYRQGYSDKESENPPMVTVTVERNSQRRWKPVREGIIEILKRFALVIIIIINSYAPSP